MNKVNTSSFVVDMTKVNILEFEWKMRKILRTERQNIWFSDGVIDIMGRITVTDSVVDLKENTIFKHQIKEKTHVPFMTYVSTTGIDESQVYCMSSKTRRKHIRESIARFLSFFECNHACEDIFPKNSTFIVSPYIQRYPRGEISSICLYFETDDNTWNFYEKSHPLELEAGSIYYSYVPVISSERNESLREFVLRKTIHQKRFN